MSSVDISTRFVGRCGGGLGLQGNLACAFASLTHTRPASERKGQIVRLNKIATAAFAGLIVLPLAACGGGGATTGSSSPNAGATLTYWASNQGTSLNNDKQVLTP